MAKETKRKLGGRPRRLDNPTPIRVLLPGELRQWLRVQAAIEVRDQGDIVTDALRAYRKTSRHTVQTLKDMLVEDTTGATNPRQKGGRQ
jgi:hypothetical protein